MSEMYVKKRNGELQIVSFDKILNRVKKLAKEPGLEKLEQINFTELVMKVIEQLYDGMTTHEIDELTSQQCASMSTINSDYGHLASRIVVSNHHKNTKSSFMDIVDMLYNFKDIHGNQHPIVSETLYNVTKENKERIQSEINFQRDFLFDYFGFKTLERAYLQKMNKIILERPQHMWMRVALGIHGYDIDTAIETYHFMSQKYFTHATPTLFNSGTPRSQMSSCYLLAMEDDSIRGMYNTLTECALISKWSGGIGLHLHNVRANGSHIRGTNGQSSGLIPLLRVYNNTARHVNQGGKRNGSFAMYLEPWHADILDFLQMRKNHGDEEMKARDLFFALWIPDLFMKRVKENGEWTLMCPDKCPGLSDVYGDEFEELYKKYESEGRGNSSIPARKVWFAMLESQIETGTPYMLFKDAANNKSNQKNLGTIKSSNLCTEIIEYSDSKETAVCNLASIGLSRFVEKTENDTISGIQTVKIYSKTKCPYCKLAKQRFIDFGLSYEEIILDDDKERHEFYEKVTQKEELDLMVNSVPQIYINNKRIGGYESLQKILTFSFNFNKLHEVTKIITNNLNKVIDVNFYPTEKTKRSNFYHRPVGIGVQGLADAFALMDTTFDSDQAKQLNKDIFETIYHAALEKSNEIAIQRNKDMTVLMQYYTKGWNFKRNIDDYEKEYVFEDKINEPVMPQEIKDLVMKVKPIKKEIDKLTETYIGSYSSFIGSPAHKKQLQFDMWNVTPSTKYNWIALKESIAKYGTRNSLLVAPMPTASTSQILGNNECFEPFTSNIYVRNTLAGEFVLVNKHLMRDLKTLGVWDINLKNNIIASRGSIQHMDFIPKSIRQKYRTVWEIPMKSLIDMATDRGAYICQSQSMNLWMETPTMDKLTAMHFYSWSKGLKTGIYYLRTKAKAEAQKFTIDPSTTGSNKIIQIQQNTDTIRSDDDGCLMCSG